MNIDKCEFEVVKIVYCKIQCNVEIKAKNTLLALVLGWF